MNISRYWQRLSVRSKISWGFAIVLLLHISIAVISHYGLHKAEVDRHDHERLHAQIESYYEIDRLVSEMQRHVLLFAFGGIKSLESRAVELQQELEARLESAKEMAPQQYQPSLLKMKEHLATHQDIFAQVVVDRAKRRELIDVQLHQCSLDFDRQLDQLTMDLAMDRSEVESIFRSFRSAELHVMKFVHSPDSSFVRQTKLDIEETQRQLQTLPLAVQNTPEVFHRLLDTIDAYETNFIQMVQATRGYLHLTNVVLAGESQEIFYLASQIRDAYSEQAENLTTTMADDSERYRQASSVFSLLTIVLGLIASWAIQKSISPPLNKITETITGLANGKTYEKIPGVERRDELGRLAAAAQVFKEKAAETERLLEEVKLMREQERNHAHSLKLEALGQLAAGIAHEINTPLQCVASNVEFLEESHSLLTEVIDDCCHLLEFELTAKAVDRNQLQELILSRRFDLMKSESPMAASEAAEAVRRVVDIISAMKTLSHPGTDHHSEADVNELVRSAATLSKHRWRDHAELEFQLNLNLPTVPVHQSEISQVLINLLVNAGDAIAEQADRTGKIIVTTRMATDGIEILVADNGGGIPASHLHKIFDPFFTTKEVGQGTGQGLSLAYDVMVRRHQGEIDVQSSEEGTTFRLYLPFRTAGARCAISL